MFIISLSLLRAYGQGSAPLTNDGPEPGLAPNGTDKLSRVHVVAIDVGHTKAHPGAISATGKPEYDFNLRMAERLHSVLSQNPTTRPVIITSLKDLTLVERTRLAAAQKADLFVAIHHDSAQPKYMKAWVVDGKKRSYSDDFSGYGVFVSRKNRFFGESLRLAQQIGREMSAQGIKFATHHAEAVRGENRPIIDPEAGIYAYDDLVVLKTAPMPAVLVECGVIVNRNEERLLLTPEHQQLVAFAIAKGVGAYVADSPPRSTGSSIPIRKAVEKNYPKPGTPLPQPTPTNNRR